MRNRNWVFGFLFVGAIIAYAQPKPEEILQKAIIREATLTYSYEQKRGEVKTTVKQKRNSDGSVWRAMETIRGDINKKYWSANKRIIYNSDGCIDLWISQYEITGIVTQDEIPLHRIGKDSTFKMTSVTYDGRSCWKITEYTARGEFDEFIIDKAHVFILAQNYYDASGKLLYPVHKKNINFNPVLSDAEFSIPPNAKLSYAKNFREKMELDTKRVQRHSNFVIKKRKQMVKKVAMPKPHGKLRQQWGRVTNYDTLGFICQKAPWFLLPIAIVSIVIVIWMKRKNNKN